MLILQNQTKQHKKYTNKNICSTLNCILNLQLTLQDQHTNKKLQFINNYENANMLT